MVPSAVWKRPRPLSILIAAVLSLAPRVCGAAPSNVGAHAPPIELADLTGRTWSVDWRDGSPAATVVYFFDPQSPDCLLEMSFLDSVYLRARDLGLAVYAIEAKGRQPAEVSRTMERYCTVYREPAFPVLPDPSFRAGRTYGVERAPVTFVMESHGVILNRIEGYDHGVAVAIARRVEQLIGRERGFLSRTLREVGVSEAEERTAESRIAAAAAAAAPSTRARGSGDRAPELEFTDLTGRAGRWAWSGPAAQGVRIVVFFGGLSLESTEELSWLDALARRGRDVGLEVLAVEAGGLDEAALKGALDKYRRYHPDPSFPVVADPGGDLVRAFGPWERLPQTYVLSPDGTIIQQVDGFSPAKAEAMAEKVERSYLLAGRPFPSARSAAAAAPPPVEEEAPSIRNRRQQDERYRSNIVLADSAYLSWEFDKALAHYLEALEAQPKDLHALVRAAQLSERRGQPDRALGLWQRVLAVQPDHLEATQRVRELRPSR